MKLKKIIQDELDSFVDLYKHLHANPELSNQEEKTSKIIADQLESYGILVSRNFGGYGVVGLLENGVGPTVMIRTDMDALPITEESGADYASCIRTLDLSGNQTGVMHACGHDMHMTAFLGVAKVLSTLKDKWSGRIIFVGQPAEEDMSGARQMISHGLFKKFGRPDFCLATHVAPTIESGKIAVCSGPIMAGTFQLKIIAQGVGGHGAFPQESRDPIVLAARIINSLQTIVSREFNPLNPAVVTVGSIHGGIRANIIPDKVVMEVTTRFADSEGRNKIFESIERICRYEALAMNIPENLLPIIEFDEKNEVPATINDSLLAETVKKAVCSELGSQNFVETEMAMGSEDFAIYRTALPEEIPSCLFFTGATSISDMEKLVTQGINPPSLHNCKFLPPPESTILAATTTMTATAIQLLSK
ncbi:M20 metallopeptidase family protein [Maridesulfovibrio zosterae]|uniref:M20 metallopeptidase family protein n=1 Tax=Maridesulfovibrio zosterae TaxID=82171 RepID=UPI0003FE3877|nr:amidohydrolase [Maridesulfovibrio zosterae]